MSQGTVTVRVLGDASHLNRTINNVDDRLKGFGASIARVTAAVTTGAVLAGGVLLKGAVAEAREAAKVTRITANAIRTTGGAANVTAEQVARLSEAISNKTAIDDEQIQTAANMLLTFKKVRNEAGAGNDVFNRATQAAADLSIQFGGIDNASKQLGKALADPVKGIGALTRAGIDFTAEQKKQIKEMVKVGDVLGAQKIILAEVEGQVGGAAAAAADPMQKLGVIVDNLKERLGTALLPVIEKVATWLGNSLPGAMDKGAAIARTLQDAFKGLQPIFETVGDVVRRVSDAVAEWWTNNSVKITQVLERLKEAFNAVFGAIAAVVATVVAVITDIWARFGNTLLEKLQSAFNAIMTIIGGVFQFLTGVFDLIKAVLTGKWGEAWEAIKSIVGGVWETIKGVVSLGWVALSSAFEAGKAAISAAWSLLWNSLKTVVADIWRGIAGVISSAIGGILKTMDRLLGPLDEVIGKVAKIGSVGGGIGRAFKALPGFAGGVTNFSGGLAVVGEKGPEIVRLPRGSDVYPNGTGPAMPSGAPPVTVNINGILAQDAGIIADMLGTKLGFIYASKVAGSR